MNEKKTIILIGMSGSGKGTQAEFLENELKKDGEVLYIELGKKFREFLSMNTHTAKMAKKIAKEGLLQPEFLAVHLWADIFNMYYGQDKNLILDGSPRTLREAYILDGALKFYNIENPQVIYIKISDQTAKKRMMERKREDDGEEKIERRIKWFNKDVLSAVDFFKENEYYDFLEIDGERKIEEIKKEIFDKIFSKNLI